MKRMMQHETDAASTEMEGPHAKQPSRTVEQLRQRTKFVPKPHPAGKRRSSKAY